MPLLTLLPDVLHIPSRQVGPALDTTLRLLAGEISRPEAGAGAVRNGIVDILLVQLLRAWHAGAAGLSKVGRYCLAHAQCPVVAIPPPALAGELGHGRLAWMFWRRSLTPEQVLRDHDRPAA